MSEIRCYWKYTYDRGSRPWVIESKERWAGPCSLDGMKIGKNTSFGRIDGPFKHIPFLRLYLLLGGDDVRRYLK